jgi:uncharacterized protein YutE (UPF0331/DUF86 family)
LALAVVDEVVASQLKLLAQYVDELHGYRDLATNFEVCQGNRLLRRAVERTLQVSAEACLDIGRQIISEEGFRFPADNKEVFQVLAEEGIVSQDLLSALLDMARFRNLIVRDYARIDDVKVYTILKRKLPDLDAYARAIVEYLEGA